MVQAVSAGHAGHDQPPKHRGYLGVKATETASGRRATGRQRQDGAVLRVVRAVTGAQVKPLLLSQSSLPAVGQEAHTESSQVLSRTRYVVTAADVSAEADAAAAEHTAMLNMLRARWQASKQDTIWTRAYKGAVWRLFWASHLTGLALLDFEERAIIATMYTAVFGLMGFEACRRLIGGIMAVL